MTAPYTGGCQCGAVRYRAQTLAKASICHCRMCQKAAGNYFAPLVEVEGFAWTRGKPGVFASSNLSNRLFCPHCGTPLALETDGAMEIMIGSLDDPSAATVLYHANPKDRLPVTECLHTIPDQNAERAAENDAWNARIINNQHPDHDTEAWKPK
ncbi:MAG: GFA family protein [Pseudomonadota bacterium]